MRFEDERYVRVYTRDTPDLLAIGWEGRAVLWELIRKVDRAGVIDLAKGDIAVLPELLRLPPDVFWAGWERLVKRGLVELGDTAAVIPRFIEAQEARQSDKSRARESRARRRDLARTGTIATPVTKRDNRSQGGGGAGGGDLTDDLTAPNTDFTKRDAAVTKRDAAVTARDASVTKSHNLSLLAVPSRTVLTGPLASLEGPGARTSRNVTRADPPGDPDAKRPERPEPMGAPGHREVVAGFDALFRERTGHVPGWDGAAGKMVLRLLAKAGSAGPDEILRRARVMFDATGKFPAEHPDLATLLAHWDKFVGGSRDVRVGHVRAEGTTDYGPLGRKNDF